MIFVNNKTLEHSHKKLVRKLQNVGLNGMKMNGCCAHVNGG
jgi:hypothetical protein